MDFDTTTNTEKGIEMEDIKNAIALLGGMLEQDLITNYYGKDEMRELKERLESISNGSEVEMLKNENKLLKFKLNSVQSILKDVR